MGRPGARLLQSRPRRSRRSARTSACPGATPRDGAVRSNSWV
jgi:hypothetical protein